LNERLKHENDKSKATQRMAGCAIKATDQSMPDALSSPDPEDSLVIEAYLLDLIIQEEAQALRRSTSTDR